MGWLVGDEVAGWWDRETTGSKVMGWQGGGILRLPAGGVPVWRGDGVVVWWGCGW